MKEGVISLLSKYGYRVGYSGCYTDEELKAFLADEPGMAVTPTFTLYDKDSLVIRRIPDLYKNTDMKKKHIEILCDAFSIYEIPHRDQIIIDLRNLLK